MIPTACWLANVEMDAPVAANQGEVNPDEGTIDGMIRIAGEECAFTLSLLE